MIEDDVQLKELGVSHFSELFSDDGLTNIEDQLKVVRPFPTMVSDEEKYVFLSDITLSEIESILKGFKKEKSPGPDGWPVEFYLHFFHLIGMDILRAVDQYRKEGRISGSLNSTFVTLIPKSDKSSSFFDFRPISLYNLIYKVISKLASIRIKPILDKAITWNKFGFLHNRKIVEPIGIT